MRIEMYIHTISCRIDPRWMGQALSSLDPQRPQADCLTLHGMKQCMWLESLDDAGCMIWLSGWESLEDCEAFIASPTYRRWFATFVAHMQVEPQWNRYSLLAYLVNEESG